MLWALLILLLVILLHEMGHWFVARWWKFPTPVLSVGFGPKLLKYRWNDTEWRLCLIPLGGYVEIPQLARNYRVAFHPTNPRVPIVSYVPHKAEDGTELRPATGWQRMTIAVAGPLVNLIIGIVLLVFLARETMPIPAALDSSTVGFPIPGALSYAPDDGGEIQSGDFLTTYKTVAFDVSKAKGPSLSLFTVSGSKFTDLGFERVKADGSKEKLKFSVKLSPAFGADARAPLPILPMESVIIQQVTSGPDTIAGRAGLKAGDHWLALADSPLGCPAELAFQLRKLAGQQVTGRLLRDGAELPIQFTVPAVPDDSAHLADWLSFTVQTEEKPQRMIGVQEVSVAALLAKIEEQIPAGKDTPSESSGMLGTAGVVTHAEKHRGSAGILLAAAVINLAVMFFNLLPIPPLDGGRILEGFIEIMIRRPVPAVLTLWKDLFGIGFILTLLASMVFSDLWTAGHNAIRQVSPPPVAAIDSTAAASLRSDLKWLGAAEDALRGRTKGGEK